KLETNIDSFVNALIISNRNYVVIFPNNDLGSNTIIKAYEKIRNHSSFKIFPSIRFEYFLTLMKNAEFMIGNSSAGIREAIVYGTPSIDVGNRQKGRYVSSDEFIQHVEEDEAQIINA
ncbi:UDP-N-acetylglucosamine 2-epimerase (hydrolyzing), partial [Butyricicoccus sp. 1XD8-22]